MIKTNELRIGNLFFDREHRICKCEKITKENYSILSVKGGITSLPIKPIPLTEELLLKCGAKYLGFIDELEDVKEYCLGNGITIDWHIHSDECSVFYNNSCVSYYDDNEIKLHQLQNLYFALTGEELEIKL